MTKLALPTCWLWSDIRKCPRMTSSVRLTINPCPWQRAQSSFFYLLFFSNVFYFSYLKHYYCIKGGLEPTQPSCSAGPAQNLCHLYPDMGLQLGHKGFPAIKITVIQMRMYCSLSVKINMRETPQGMQSL